MEPLGRDDLLEVRVEDLRLNVLADPSRRVRMGERVRLHFDPRKVQFFDPTTERSLLWDGPDPGEG